MEQENRVRMERIAADPQSGLSAEQVKRRFAQGENNYKVESSTLSVPEIVRSNVCTYFNLVFAVIAVLLAIVGAWSDMLFLPIIVANTCIGIIQEVHSKKVLDKLSILNAPHAVVIRDGKRQEIPADQLSPSAATSTTKLQSTSSSSCTPSNPLRRGGLPSGWRPFAFFLKEFNNGPMATSV